MSSDHHHHDHDHDHDHDHPHAPPQPDDKVHSYYQILSIALKELLIEKGVVTAAQVRQFIEKRDSITPAHGAKVVARAWVDPAYRTRLFEDGNAAAAELGFPIVGLAARASTCPTLGFFLTKITKSGRAFVGAGWGA